MVSVTTTRDIPVKVVEESVPLDPRAVAGVLALCLFMDSLAGILKALARDLRAVVA